MHEDLIKQQEAPFFQMKAEVPCCCLFNQIFSGLTEIDPIDELCKTIAIFFGKSIMSKILHSKKSIESATLLKKLEVQK